MYWYSFSLTFCKRELARSMIILSLAQDSHCETFIGHHKISTRSVLFMQFDHWFCDAQGTMPHPINYTHYCLTSNCTKTDTTYPVCFPSIPGPKERARGHPPKLPQELPGPLLALGLHGSLGGRREWREIQTERRAHRVALQRVGRRPWRRRDGRERRRGREMKRKDEKRTGLNFGRAANK